MGTVISAFAVDHDSKHQCVSKKFGDTQSGRQPIQSSITDTGRLSTSALIVHGGRGRVAFESDHFHHIKASARGHGCLAVSQVDRPSLPPVVC
jgi:hypothetical protein